MLFHEIYGSYYQTASLILKEAVKGTLTKKSMVELVQEYAFGESFLSIPDGLTGERWRLLHKDLTTPLITEPSMPLTRLQKRWLKALLLDPRIQLFDPDPAGLEDVEPLFTPDMFVYYDRYTNGDNYRNEEYINRFRTILTAIREKKDLSVRYESRSGFSQTLTVTPHHLEYSEKDDRFRLYAVGKYRTWILNLSRIKDSRVMDTGSSMPFRLINEQKLSFELTDYRNALERALLHFSHLRKETKRLDRKRYRVTLYYDQQDETELVIRLLSFGPMIKITEPSRMIDLVYERIEKQRELARCIPGREENASE